MRFKVLSYLVVVASITTTTEYLLNYSLKGEIQDVVYNPYDMWIIDELSVIVNDLADKQEPIKLIDIEEGYKIKSLKTGQGPGEVSATQYKRVTKYSDNSILLFDAGNQRLTKYNSNLDYKFDLSGSALSKRVYQAGLVNDSTLILIDNSESFIRGYRFSSKYVNESDILFEISMNDYSELNDFKNFALLQAMFITNSNSTMYLSNEFASFIIALDEKGVKWISNIPNGFNLPVADSENLGYMMPRIGSHPEGSRGIYYHNGYVFMHFHGETISRLEQMRYTFNFDSLLEKMKHTSKLMVFEANTGEFIGKYFLPEHARNIGLVGEKLLLINSLDHAGNIRVYERK
jgi:hypothetical protein